MKEIAKLIANEPKKTDGERTTIITQGSKAVVVAKSGDSNVMEFPVPQLEDEKVVDTNGAGDAFTGGFLAMYIQKKPLDVCIRCGIYCAVECVQRLGCTFPNQFKFEG
jgi:adenosine kinase